MIIMNYFNNILNKLNKIYFFQGPLWQIMAKRVW